MHLRWSLPNPTECGRWADKSLYKEEICRVDDQGMQAKWRYEFWVVFCFSKSSPTRTHSQAVTGLGMLRIEESYVGEKSWGLHIPIHFRGWWRRLLILSITSWGTCNVMPLKSHWPFTTKVLTVLWSSTRFRGPCTLLRMDPIFNQSSCQKLISFPVLKIHSPCLSRISHPLPILLQVESH